MLDINFIDNFYFILLNILPNPTDNSLFASVCAKNISLWVTNLYLRFHINSSSTSFISLNLTKLIHINYSVLNF